jgi:hypothetical protein
MKNAGSTKPGRPYEMKFNDAFGNVVQRLVERPEILSDFFEKSNSIDKHNQLRQGDLALEKRWLTQDPYFHLHTTIIGMFIVILFSTVFSFIVFLTLCLQVSMLLIPTSSANITKLSTSEWHRRVNTRCQLRNLQATLPIN